MPFTPFHLGPAALVKAAAGRHFSFMVFGGSQVLMDLEVGVRMIIGTSWLHGPSHTLAGALMIAILATFIGKPISQWALRLIQYPAPKMSWLAAASGAFVGTFSHVVLDAIMHSDMQPWSPLSTHNTLLGVIAVPNLHWLCIISGLIGGGIYYLMQKHRSKVQ